MRRKQLQEQVQRNDLQEENAEIVAEASETVEDEAERARRKKEKKEKKKEKIKTSRKRRFVNLL